MLPAFLSEAAMSKRRFEMYQYRQILVRMRQGDSDRDIARSGLMGRKMHDGRRLDFGLSAVQRLRHQVADSCRRGAWKP
jgi:hypothetical protein